MSMYSQIFREAPLAGYLLSLLGLRRRDIPRYRDCFLSPDGAEIIIYTRTGGDNRTAYEDEEACRRNNPELFEGEDPPRGPWNADLRKIPGYLRDADGGYDSTYAHFYFELAPDIREPLVDLAGRIEDHPRGEAGWRHLFKQLDAKNEDDPLVQRSYELAAKMARQIEELTPTATHRSKPTIKTIKV